MSNLDGGMPSGLAQGGSKFENINYYNGGLRISIPMLKVGGRGDAGFTIPLKVNNRSYIVNGSLGTGPYGAHYWNWDVINSHNYGDTYNPQPDYGPGRMTADFSGDGLTQESSGPRWFYSAVGVRLTFSAPDGTQYNFYSQKSFGGPLTSGVYDNWLDFGTVFISEQSTQITFISDAPLATGPGELPNGTIQGWGWMYLPNGTRYRIEDSLVKKSIDRNGNQITYTYDSAGRVLTITDPLNRQVQFAYGQNLGAQGTCDVITFPGFGGTPRTILVTRTNLSGALVSGSQVVWSDLTQVAKTMWLPDGRKYEFRYTPNGEVARIVLPTGGGFEYDYAAGVVGGPSNGLIGPYNVHIFGTAPQQMPGVYRRLVTRRDYKDISSGVYE
ncbi:MAG: RHS repeat domain-containing protein, partial [Pyrinomonadaceae bacterium]